MVDRWILYMIFNIYNILHVQWSDTTNQIFCIDWIISVSLMIFRLIDCFRGHSSSVTVMSVNAPWQGVDSTLIHTCMHVVQWLQKQQNKIYKNAKRHRKDVIRQMIIYTQQIYTHTHTWQRLLWTQMQVNFNQKHIRSYDNYTHYTHVDLASHILQDEQTETFSKPHDL